MKVNLTQEEIQDTNSRQIYTLESKISNGDFCIEEIGDYVPGNVLVTNLKNLSTEYMNSSGCNILKHSTEELAALGPEYFQRFFFPEEMNVFVPTYLQMHREQNLTKIYNFAHRVKNLQDASYKWYLASAKLMYSQGDEMADKMLLIVNEVNSAGRIARQINNVLEETGWMKNYFKQFCLLTKREKEIIILVVSGNSSVVIADALQITKLTVSTHRRNISDKLKLKTFSELYRFATAFGLIP
ncbi:DNA-binding CsgD family transcriptional regulator [Pedobacter sp. UYEF25]